MSNAIKLRTWLISDQRTWKWIAGLLLFVATLFIYHPVWHAGFIWDDDDYVTNNTLLTAPDGLRRIWFSGDSPSQYFPLTYTVFRMEYRFWTLDQTGYHLFNVFLHAVNALLVWRLLQRLVVPGAWLAAAIFALHPVQVESVAWVSELKNVLMCFFFLLSLLCWVEFLKAGPKPRRELYLLSLILFALALFSKTTACTLPAALMLILWFRNEPVGKMRIAQIIPFMVMSLGMGVITILWERHHIGTSAGMFSMSLADRILIASHAIWFYLAKLLVPVNLMFSYPKWEIAHEKLQACGWLAALAGLGSLIIWSRRLVGRGPETAMLFHVLTLSPLLGFIMLYTFRYTYVADHYQYVACIGPIAIFSAGVAHLFKNRPLIRHIVCTGLLLGLGTLTWRQARIYENAETLWRATIDGNPGSWMAYGNLGCILLKDGKAEEAIACEQKAVQLNPRYSEGFNNLGVALFQAGRVDEAIGQYRRAADIRPDDWEVYYNLGNAFFQKGNMDDAVVSFQASAKMQPASAAARCHLGNAYFQQGKLDEAILAYQLALKVNPVSLEAQNNLGSADLRQGNLDQATIHFQLALKINPRLAETHNNLGDAFLRQQRVAEAAAQFLDALAIRPDYAPARSNLDIVNHWPHK
ncbi:MAG: tetratricopeptide repeat protein [Verrucomicrobiae bacterium]|nr:tetratricopeptide repeat protein [Verrucomicrobiae bacterium]